MVFGEITTRSPLDYQKIIRDTIKRIGYDDSEKGFDYKTCNVLVAIEQQSVDIAQGLDHGDLLSHGAGDQGIMFGYATNGKFAFPRPLELNTEFRVNSSCRDPRTHAPHHHPCPQAQQEDGRPPSFRRARLVTS